MKLTYWILPCITHSHVYSTSTVLCALYTGLLYPLLYPRYVITIPTYNAHSYFALKKLGKNVHIVHGKIRVIILPSSICGKAKASQVTCYSLTSENTQMKNTHPVKYKKHPSVLIKCKWTTNASKSNTEVYTQVLYVFKDQRHWVWRNYIYMLQQKIKSSHIYFLAL